MVQQTGRQRDDRAPGWTYKAETHHGSVFVMVNWNTSDPKGQPIEVITHLGYQDGKQRSEAEADGRMISLALRYGANLAEIIHQLRGIKDETLHHNGGRFESIPDAIAQCLAQALEDGPPV